MPQPPDPTAPWARATTREATADPARHTIHAYFNTCPESPDGRHLLYYASDTDDAHTGHLQLLDRHAHTTRSVATGLTCEDGHRVACQQWIDGGKHLLYHDVRQGVWTVLLADTATLTERVIATDRQLAFGSPTAPWAAIYGPHWDPDASRDLELIHIHTDQRLTITPAQVRAAFPQLTLQLYGDTPFSIFFPILSPDATRVFFKLASPGEGDWRSWQASTRRGLFVWDLTDNTPVHAQEEWGHPCWMPDSRTILNVPNTLLDTDTGVATTIPGLPRFPGSHPVPDPTATHFVTDANKDVHGTAPGEYTLSIASLAGHHYRLLAHLGDAPGTTSWRPPHPHPTYSADGRRIYYNANHGHCTRLHVAELPI